jgi:hypothetical protein
MAITFDQRPTVFGDRIIVTGTFAASDTSIDLSSMMSSVDACIANLTSAESPVEVRNSADNDAIEIQPTLDVSVSGTTVTLSTFGTGGPGAPSGGGTFLAIGRRG